METFTQIFGWAGALLIISAYFLISHKKLSGANKIYQLMNLIGATGVGVNALYQEAWPSFFIQVIWIIIAVASLIKLPRNNTLKPAKDK